MAEPNIRMARDDAGVCTLTIHRPHALNALNRATLEALHATLVDLRPDASLRALLLTGAGGKAFVAGADIGEMQNYTPTEARQFSELGMRVMHALEALPVPVIALVDGYALGGGCELALSCDWILASERAVFGQPEVSLGIPPGFGGTQRLTRRVGRAMALELLTTGRQLRADEALRLGLVNHVYPAAELHAKGTEMAHAIAAKGPVAVRLAKQAAQRGAETDLVNGCLLETDAFALAFATADQKEGMRAFIEKRAPAFTGK